MEVKKCFTCKVNKPKNEYYSNKARSNGIYGSCITCVKAKIKYPKSSDLTICYPVELLEKEVWRSVWLRNEISKYLISSCGRVKLPSGKFAKPSFDSRGYPQIVLTVNKKRIGRRLHILVAEAFIGNPLNLREVNHINGDKLFPHYSNLEYCTSKYNSKHALDTGLRIPKRKDLQNV